MENSTDFQLYTLPFTYEMRQQVNNPEVSTALSPTATVILINPPQLKVKKAAAVSFGIQNKHVSPVGSRRFLMKIHH